MTKGQPRLIVIGAILLSSVTLVACQSQNASDTGSSHQTSKVAQNTNQKSTSHKGQRRAQSMHTETPPASQLTTILSSLTTKLPEDTSTQTNGQKLYSQFYYRDKAWNFHLTDENGQQVTGGKVTNITKAQDSSSWSLQLITSNGASKKIDLTYDIDHQAQYYQLQGDQINGKHLFLLGNGAGTWTTGVPKDLEGTWSTDFFTDSDSSSGGYQRIRFSISNQKVYAETSSYTKNYTWAWTGTYGGMEPEKPAYQQLSDGSYLIKEYAGQISQPGTTVFYTTFKIKMSGNTMSMQSTATNQHQYTRISNDPGLYQGYDDKRAANLTESQVSDWAARHLSDFGMNKHSYSKAGFDDFKMNKKGELTFEARDEGRGSIAPLIGTFRIDKNGVLYGKGQGDDNEWLVSDDPNH